MSGARAEREVRVIATYTLPGKNYWSRRPITRLDLAIGVFEDISSAEVPNVGERLVDALPGLVEHHCSVGTRGGFVQRLARGTYVGHIVEHVALELQRVAGDDVGYGRTRGGAALGEYVVALEHVHAAVGLAAALAATRLVCAAFDEETLDVDAAHTALDRARREPDDPPPNDTIDRAICAPVSVARSFEIGEHATIVEPAVIVERGLPFALARLAIVPRIDPLDAPAAFRDPERLEQLYSVMVDGLAAGGTIMVPRRAESLAAQARERGCRVVTLDDGVRATA